MATSLLETMTEQVAFDGQPARLFRLVNRNGMAVTLMDIGATWLSCTLPVNGAEREVLLGTSGMEGFSSMKAYMGVTAGRYANRITKGQFELNGEKYQLEVNHAGNTLHGGVKGFDKYRWRVDSHGEDFVEFCHYSPHGDQGFPGNLKVKVRYTLSQQNKLIIRYQGSTDKATPCNLTNHAYFNLLGEDSQKDCLSHILEIKADHYLPTNKAGIPLGGPESVSETSFDFRKGKAVSKDLLSDKQQQNVSGYDHSFLLNPQTDAGDYIAKLMTEDQAVVMKVFTDKPAIQLYTGNWMEGEPNRRGEMYQNYAGLALETQFLPDSPNHPEWPQVSSILQPGEKYHSETCYQFEF